MDQFLVREISPDDYHLGYLDILYELSDYDLKLSESEFKKRLEQMIVKSGHHIVVIVDQMTGRIVAAGTVLIIFKIHCNSIGIIEDVVVSNDYRRQGLGTILIEKLCEFPKKYGCYKTVLRCKEVNIPFYQSNGFEIAGVEMRIKED